MSVRAFLFGATLGAAIGPVAIFIIRYGMTKGWRSSTASVFGAAFGDFSFALVAFTVGVVVLQHLSSYEDTIRFWSALFLVAFGVHIAIRSFFVTSLPHTPALAKNRSALLATYLLTFVSPMTIVVFVAFAGQFSEIHSLFQAIFLSLFVFAGSFSVHSIYAIAGSSMGSLIKNPSVLCILNSLSGLGIAAFGIFDLMVAK